MTNEETTLLARLLKKLLASDIARNDLIVFRTAKGLLKKLLGA